MEEKEYEDQNDGKKRTPVRLHLLTPAYASIIITEAVKIPEDIGEFVMKGICCMEGLIQPIQFNLPEEQEHYMEGVGHWSPTTMDWAMMA